MGRVGVERTVVTPTARERRETTGWRDRRADWLTILAAADVTPAVE